MTAALKSGSSGGPLRRRRSWPGRFPTGRRSTPSCTGPVTQALLWSEYRERHPDGFGYTWFTETHHAYVGRLDLVMRQDDRPGEKLFLDFEGQTIPIVDPDSCVIR
jgi:transposase